MNSTSRSWEENVISGFLLLKGGQISGLTKNKHGSCSQSERETNKKGDRRWVISHQTCCVWRNINRIVAERKAVNRTVVWHWLLGFQADGISMNTDCRVWVRWSECVHRDRRSWWQPTLHLSKSEKQADFSGPCSNSYPKREQFVWRDNDVRQVSRLSSAPFIGALQESCFTPGKNGPKVCL